MTKGKLPEFIMPLKMKPVASSYPKADFFVNHAADAVGRIPSECYSVYLQNLAQVLIADEGVFNHA